MGSSSYKFKLSVQKKTIIYFIIFCMYYYVYIFAIYIRDLMAKL